MIPPTPESLRELEDAQRKRNKDKDKEKPGPAPLTEQHFNRLMSRLGWILFWLIWAALT